MKKRFSISHSVVFLLTIIALVSLSLALAQPQDPPPADDLTLEVGSTDGITVLSFIISAIIILPLLSRGALKRNKENPEK